MATTANISLLALGCMALILPAPFAEYYYVEEELRRMPSYLQMKIKKWLLFLFGFPCQVKGKGKCIRLYMFVLLKELLFGCGEKSIPLSQLKRSPSYQGSNNVKGGSPHDIEEFVLVQRDGEQKDQRLQKEKVSMEA
eukprot:11385898-Ditylum_brightwellii.AAC.1